MKDPSDRTRRDTNQHTMKNEFKHSAKALCFNQEVVVHKYLHIDDYSDKEIRNTWYDAYEMSAIGTTNRETLYAMISHGDKVSTGCTSFHDENRFCSRGLETWVGIRAQQKRERRTRAYDAVLDEQDFQWEHGIFDEERIAREYVKTTRESRTIAREMALRDEQYVKSIPTLITPNSVTLPPAALIRPPRLRKISGTAA